MAKRFSNRFIVGTAAEQSSFAASDYTDFYYIDTINEKIQWSNGTNWIDIGGNSIPINALTDVDTITVAPQNNDVLTWNNTDSEWVPAAPPGASGGEANDAANVGIGEGEIYRNKVSEIINLKTLKAGANTSITNNADDVTIASSSGGIGNIADADDTNFTTPQTGHIIEYNDVTSDWENVAHDHSGEFSTLGHDHDTDYSDINHDHDADYSALLHHHDADYAGISHNHDADYADITHQHAVTDLSPTGTSLQVVRTNSSGDGVEWASLDSERTGLAEATGDGSTTQFTIDHGLGALPSYAFVDCASHAIARTWTLSSTQIIIDFVSAPPTESADNVKIYWRVIA